MRFRRLGDSGLAVSVVGLGCNNFGRRMEDRKTAEVVHTALDLGINLFDTADIYGDPPGRSEELLALALGSRRDEAIIATKFGSDMDGANGPDWGARGSRRYVHRAVEASLRRLRTDYIDLYQIHAPDPATPIAETLDTLDDLVRAGKVRYIGSSNFAAWQVADAAWTAQYRQRAGFVSAQNVYSLLEREADAELVPACQRFGMGLLPYFPLARGLLTGKYRRGQPPPAGSRLARANFAPTLAHARWDVIERLEKYAEKRGLTLLDVAIGGLAALPAVTSVIAGATTSDHVRANVAAGRWQPSTVDLDELNEITRV